MPPAARKFGNRHFGKTWTFQQDGATAHTATPTQKWCGENLPAFIQKKNWPPNSSDLNPLDCSIWNEMAQAIKWNKVTSKATRRYRIKLAATKIPRNVVLDRCADFYTRVRSGSCTQMAAAICRNCCTRFCAAGDGNSNCCLAGVMRCAYTK